MGDRLIDLNAVIAPDISVELGDETYKLPGDAPTEDLLRILVKAEDLERIGQEGGKTAAELLEMREDLSVDVEDLFRLRQPDLEEGAIRLNDAQTAELLVGLMRIYADALAGAQEEGGARPTSTRPKPRSGRRSRTSSGGSRKKPKASASSTSSRT